MREFHAGWPVRVSAVAAGLVALTGLVVLIGWEFGIAALKSVAPGWARMSPITALSFLVAGAALGAAGRSRRPGAAPGWGRAAVAGAGLLFLAGAVRLGAYAGLYPFGADLLGFPGDPAGLPARMSQTTALSFLLAGAGLLLSRRRGAAALQAAGIAGILVSWVGFAHFLFGGAPLFHFQFMALHTSLAFFVLHAGILCLRGDAGLAGLLASRGPGGEVARGLVPAALLVPLAVGWARLWGQRAGYYGTEAGVSLVSMTNVLVFGGLIWATAARLRRSEGARLTAEAARDDQSRLVRAIVDSSDDAIITKGLDGVVTSWNRGAEKTFGYAAAEMVGKPMTALFPPDRLREEEQLLERLRRNEPVAHYETVRLRKGGAPIHVSVSISPLRDASGAVVGASKIARDITERKQADLKLRTQLARLDLLQNITRAIGERQDLRSIFQVVIRTLEDQLPIDFGCILLHDAAAPLLTVSGVGVKSAGVAMELALPEKARIPIDANGLSRSVEGHLVYEPDTLRVNFPFPQRLAQGGLRSLVLAPLSVESEVFGILAVARREPEAFSSGECEFLRQLSEHTALAAHQAQLLDALQRAYDDLRQTQQAVLQQERLRAFGEMASGVAHDINNTLSPAMIYAQLLLDKETNLAPASRGQLETIQQAINDVSETIARLREFYRQREPQLAVAPVALNALARQVAEITRARWSDMPQQRGVVVALEHDLAPGLPDVLGAESELREALTNLVFNAVDAMPQGGTLTLRTQAAGKSAVLEVSDTGLGMSEETRRRCLEPFYTTKGEAGTGLGLAMVYGIVRRHHADLEIESAPGKGTTIRIVFPAAAVPAASAPKAAPAAPRRLRLLVVDDDPLLLKSMRDILEADGHRVSIANGGQAGIDAFQEARNRGEAFDATITDLGMPYVDGRAVARALKGFAPETPVLLLTGWGKRIVAEDEIPAHVDCVLSKPPKLNELRTALAEWTAKASAS